MWRWVNPEKHRYYQADLIRDLFGDWVLVSAWGSLGSNRGAQRKTPFGLELLATVEEVINRIHAWNTRKLQFTPRQIGLAVAVLSRQGWVSGVHGVSLIGNQ
jgi:hypothetical protein